MAKTVNYTEAQVAELTAGYTGSDNKSEVAVLAAKIGKTPASVRAKLSQMGIYVKTEAEAEKSERVTKRDIVDSIAQVVSLTEAEVEGLEKATKSALEKVLANLA
jgi:hypothetical protein